VNANLNIGRLGAVSSTYHVDFYGEMAGINAGVPSDRLLAEWHVVSERVAAYADGAVTFPDAVQRVHIGKDFERWMADDPECAVREKLRVRGEIVGLFSDGFAVCGYDADRADYLLAKSPHP
jgi:predicted GNAT superfamily acetyltransferase